MEYKILKGSERTMLPGAKVIKSADSDEWIEVSVKICRRNPLPKITSRPQKALTLDELSNTYGAKPEDMEKVHKALEGYGLKIIDENLGTHTIKVAGTASKMLEVFNVHLFHYSHEGGNFRGRIGAIHVPSELANFITGIYGFSTHRVAKRHASPKMKEATSISIGEQHKWFYPAELAEIYNFPSGDGSGETIGVLEFGGGFFPSDLEQFCKDANVTVPTVIPVSVDGTPTNVKDTQETYVEVMLDVEVIAGVCPKSTIVVYFCSFNERGWVDILDAAIHDKKNQPKILSVSYGWPEDFTQGWTQSAVDTINESLQEAALAGITICVSSGDDGSSDALMDGHAHVDFPSCSPYVLSVGGTNLVVSHGKTTETAWKDGDGLRQDGGGSTGGGVSVYFDRPGWQNVKIKSVNPGSKEGRCIPDVAAHAETDVKTTGYWIVAGGKGFPEGGTSASTPLWASLIALINAKLGKSVGYITPLLYKKNNSGNTIGADTCNDITVGNNITAKIGGYKAEPGYDATTGWGSPNGKKFLTAITPLI